MKKILTVQDISCFGKCSLTVASPIISAAGVEAVILPTAVLSTHTMFKGFRVKDMSDTLIPFCEHWKDLNISFDGIYTGYLGSLSLIDLTDDVCKMFYNGKTKLFVDPVMADNGKLYPTFGLSYVEGMKTLCKKADVLLPNITEACFLTGNEYKEKYDESYILKLIEDLKALGAKKIVLKGVSFEKDKLGILCYDCESNEKQYYMRERIPENFHGTGDIFASVLSALCVKGVSLYDSAVKAADFVVESLNKTLAEENHNTYGVNFEQALYKLTK